jgi:hypothetical protein
VRERNEIDQHRSLHKVSNPEPAAGTLLRRWSVANLLIEGVNFDVLRFLRMTHAGQGCFFRLFPPRATAK